MSFSCAGSEDSNPPPPPPSLPPPLVKKYTGARDDHPPTLAPTDCDAWVPPRGVKLKTDVICFSCRKAPGRDDIGLCKNCKQLPPPPPPPPFPLLLIYLLPTITTLPQTNTDSKKDFLTTARSRQAPQYSLIQILETLDSPYTSQHGGIILEGDEVAEDSGETDEGIVDFSDAYYTLLYQEWWEKEEQNIRREEERVRKGRAS
ncbi:hypothetical protein HOY80DRAFT_1096851 [Tuber brumale]|nr:hypothetical protein HOY80DRAFT_1096851 [Tuber brumale]